MPVCMASSFIFIFLSVLFGYFDIVGGIRNTGNKLNFFLLSSSGPRIAQSVRHLTCKSEILGSIPGLATYFRFSFADSRGAVVSYESMCTKYWLTA